MNPLISRNVDARSIDSNAEGVVGTADKALVHLCAIKVRAADRPTLQYIPLAFAEGVRFLEGESMSYVCREFGISRKTGYKIFGSYKEHGLEACGAREVTARMR